MKAPEQLAAFAQLRALAAPIRLRVLADGEGRPVLPGRLGQIEYHDGVGLAVFTDRPRLHQKVWAIPGSAGTRPAIRSCGRSSPWRRWTKSPP